MVTIAKLQNSDKLIRMPNKPQKPEAFTDGQLSLLSDQFKKWAESVDLARDALVKLGNDELFVFHAPSLRTGSTMVRSFLKELEASTARAAEGSPITPDTRKTRRKSEERGESIAAESKGRYAKPRNGKATK